MGISAECCGQELFGHQRAGIKALVSASVVLLQVWHLVAGGLLSRALQYGSRFC
jgi:hypothetical protein